MQISIDESKAGVQKLIDKYIRVEEAGKLRSYNESNTRKDFIDPLFECLGWEVRNKDEVTNEYKVSRKRVDYAFRLGGIPKFFLEAKAIPEDLDAPEWAEQALNYAWNKSVSWAVLCDFEGVRIFNSEVKDKNPLKAEFISIKWDEYIDRFDELWLLSKESFEKGTIDEEFEKKGIKIKKTPVDKQLLTDFTMFREILSKDILKMNKSMESPLTREDIDEAVQKILNRLIFIRKCEDIEVESIMLQAAYRKWDDAREGKLYDNVKKIFKYYDKEYDSELFRYWISDQIEVSNQAIKEVILGLYETKDGLIHYDFSAIDADVLGNIYEQYLGHILKKTKKRAKVESKHQRRKEMGIYYTPTYIVDYIVRNTVGELLKNKKFDVDKIKILDPACGSGSFLLKAFDYLNAYHAKGFTQQAHLDLTGEGAVYTKKLKILNDNIFGVDLDPKAVEIAQLNLLLKTLEKRDRLPMLQENIKNGNSLIDDEEVAGDKAFQWREEFDEIINDGRFDVVIGNPPYINAIELSKTVGAEVKKYWKDKYHAAKGTYDIYILFFEQALNVCKEGGFVSFITPNKYLSSPYGVALRKFITENYKLVKVLDLSKVKVFNDPSVYPIITIIQKIKPKKSYTFYTEKVYSEDLKNKSTFKVSSKTLSVLPNNLWGIILSDNVNLIQKIYNKSEALEDVATVQATSTAAESDEFSKYITEDVKGIKIINTGTIDRYSTTYGETRFMNKGKKLTEPILRISKINENRKKLYQSPKIIIAKLALCIEGFLDVDGSYASINTNCIHTSKEGYSLEYIAGVINSKLMSFVYSELFSGLRMSGGYFQFQAPQLRILPMIKASREEQEKISDLVMKMQSQFEKLNKLKGKETSEKMRVEKEIKKTDAKINKSVYRLYGLIDDEINVVEGND